jgi:aminoglycoside phosphotransferase (APT) family kinase protein
MKILNFGVVPGYVADLSALFAMSACKPCFEGFVRRYCLDRRDSMSPVWDADYELSDAEAAQLLEQQFPALTPAHLEILGVGWDNIAFLVNGEIVFRFPRRLMGANLLRHEQRILPLLAPLLPLPIPVPIYHGLPAADYPYEFAGYPMIPGETACKLMRADETRAAIAEQIARFLLALHSIPVDSEVRSWAPGDELRRADVRLRAPQAREQLAAISTLVPADDLMAAMDWIDQWLDQRDDTKLAVAPTCWVHGDLYARHLLVDPLKSPGRLCGVIDWGDVHLGDPALDLSIVYSVLPPKARMHFWAAYGAVDADMMHRARFRAIRYGALLTAYGTDIGDAAILRVGRDALRLATR